MKFRKIVCLLLVLIIALPTLFGCTTDEMTLFTAFLKTQNATSYSQETSVTINTKTDKVTDPNVKLVLDLLNGLTINVKTDYINNAEKQTMKEYVVLSTQIMGLKIDMPIWVDLDLSDMSEPKGKIVFKAPESLSGFFDKTYYYFDFKDLAQYASEDGMDFAAMLSLDPTGIYDSMSKLDLSGIKTAKTDAGYRVSITDDAVYPLVKQFYQVMLALPQFASLMTEDNKTEFFGMFDQMQKLDLFGDEGIAADITLNKDGYIETSAEKVGINVDFTKISQIFGIPMYDNPGIINVEYNVKSKYSAYNAVKDIEPIPELTEENSITISDAMESRYNDYGSYETPDYADDEDEFDTQYEGYRVGDVIGKVLNTDIVAYIDGKPIKSYNIDGNTAIVVEDLKNFGFDVRWDPELLWLDIYEGNGVVTSTYTPEANTAAVGSVAYDVLFSDIDTFVDDNWIRSFNVNGSTLVYIDKLVAFGNLTWDPDTKSISFSRKK